MNSQPCLLLRAAVLSLALAQIGAPAAAQVAPQEKPDPAVFDFGAARPDATIEHTFKFTNPTNAVLEILNVQMSPPLAITRMPARLGPGETGALTVQLGQPREKGDFKSPVVINFKNNAAPPQVFWVVGRIVPDIEFQPIAAFYVAVARGETKEASVEILNHGEEPLEILRVEESNPRYTTALETLEPGRRYRLTLTLTGDGPGGKQTDNITLVTGSREQPFLEIPANTYIKERVYTFPDVLDFGAIRTRELKARPDLLPFLTQTLMVYQLGGTDLQVSVSTDVPFLRLSPARASGGDRYQIEVAVNPDKLQRGKVKGSVLVMTNDPEFPRLQIPVSAVVD